MFYRQEAMSSRLALAALCLAAGLLTAACVLDRAPPAPNRAASATPIPTFTPTPRPLDSLSPTPTPTTNLGRPQAEFAVWNQVSSCANQIAGSTQVRVEVAFSSIYDSAAEVWIIQATSGPLDLSLGLWEVADVTGEVSPQDEVASAVASNQYVCNQPRALLSDALTPPLFATPTPTPVPIPTPDVASQLASTRPPAVMPTPTSTPMVANDAHAEVRVWLAVRDCFAPPPDRESFRAYQDRADLWIVEGRMEPRGTTRQENDPTVFYGLWIVDRDTGRIAGHDNLAKRIQQDRFCYLEP
jgi:hypothetical protein